MALALTPSGKNRVMMAQTYGNPLPGGASSYGEMGTEEIPTYENNLDDQYQYPTEDMDYQEGDDTYQEEERTQSNTLSDFIFNKLQSYGYPGRRLEEFKKKFVKENISPDGNKDIVVEMPDRHYPDDNGRQETIETEDLSSIVKEIESGFGLHFNGAERSEGKWTIKLTSSEVRNPEGEEGGVRDNLDEVYGTPSSNKNKKKTKPVAAFSIQEMIKGSKNNIVNKLLKMRR